MAEKKTDPEDEYFARLSLEQKQKLAEKMAAENAEKEKAERKVRHHMKCGKCGGDLAPKPFRGAEIDVCASCGAVLLDPGELELLAGEDKTGVLASLSKLFTGKVQVG
ncbi:MAG: zf-TFIIB domain-containing protein [Myxococcota bacterium]